MPLVTISDQFLFLLAKQSFFQSEAAYLSMRLAGECFPANRHSNQHVVTKEMGKRTHLIVNHSSVKPIV